MYSVSTGVYDTDLHPQLHRAVHEPIHGGSASGGCSRGPKEIFGERRHTVQISIIQVKVDRLERSKQHRNMHRLSTCNRG